MKEIEMKKMIEQRKREKIEDQKARERVRAQIAADKEARKLKDKSQMASSSETSVAPAVPVSTPSKPQRDYNSTRLQVTIICPSITFCHFN